MRVTIQYLPTMEKAENANIQNIQNEGGDTPSPNTRRRLKLQLGRPKLHIKIPFFKHGHHRHHNELSQTHDDADDDFTTTSVSRSLPSESHMPSNIRDPALYHDCSEFDNMLDNSLEDNSSNDETFVQDGGVDDAADSEKHQSDLEENEKDDDSVKPEKQAKIVGESSGVLGLGIERGTECKEGEVPDPDATRKVCLKSCLKKSCQGRPRASTYPGPADCLEASFKRCVTFSPDTVEPTTRNCKYREWIESKCPHSKNPPINVKHEKRKCQLNQMRKVNISDYMSKNYGASFFSPVATFGGDMLM